MLTYDLTNISGPIYKELYNLIKQDILEGKLKANEKMPSKRTFSKNLGISTISIENAYDQLISEGYVYTLPKKGYFVADLPAITKTGQNTDLSPVTINLPKKDSNILFDFSSNEVESSSFPFSVWAKIIREIISNHEKELMEVSPCGGVKKLRQAIAEYLKSFRGMNINPDQIIIGAGTEYLYGLLIKLLGNDKNYCIENPGWNKLKEIYTSNQAKCTFINLDKNGFIVDQLRAANGEIAHISPTHHFPTGITMPVSRRYELLSWANEENNRYIIEDDYDSEFRLNGKPIPPLQSLDTMGKVIYMNTFSKSLSSTIRISYMILPEKLANEFYKRLSFYSCTVSTFEQYTMAAFIQQGYFEKHINRMRLFYGKRRAQIINIIKQNFTENQCKILENDSGLHFILQINTKLTDKEFKHRLWQHKIKISSITDFEMKETPNDKHQFLLNYSNINPDKLSEIILYIKNNVKLFD